MDRTHEIDEAPKANEMHKEEDMESDNDASRSTNSSIKETLKIRQPPIIVES